MRGKEADGVVSVGRCFPPKRNGVTGKIPATPFKTKVRAALWREEDMIIARLIKQTGTKKGKRNGGAP